MGKKILIVEILHHHECLENVINYFKNKNYSTNVLVGSFIYNKIDFKNKINFILEQPSRTFLNENNIFKKIIYILKQFKEFYKNTKQIKKIIKKNNFKEICINTIESPFMIFFIFYLLFSKIKINIIIHKLNKICLNKIDFFIYGFLVKILLFRCRKLFLLGRYLSFFNEKLQKKVVYINNRLLKKFEKFEKFEKISFVLIGKIQEKIKDYKTVFENFSKLLKLNPIFKNKIKLIILTKLNNKNILKDICYYNLEKIIKIYKKFIPENKFEKTLLKSHYSIISVYRNSIYGKYTISGSYGDSVAFNLPILLSDNYAPSFKDKNIIRFNERNLYKVLKNVIIKEINIKNEKKTFQFIQK